ncbi:MAG: GNAT family N-acetyltransferase [Terriglobales bacterium]
MTDIRLRSCTPDDQSFLFQLYADTRRQEVSAFGWDQAQQDAFLRMQFNAQQRAYEMTYPNAEHEIILGDDQPIGRMLVMHGADAKVLVDIALLGSHRGQGTGAKLLRELIVRGDRERVPVRLQVHRGNPARRLYERLGFLQTGEDAMYFQMERTPR